MSVAFTDSAGQPWAGRHFEQNPFAGDDGAASPRLLETLAQFVLGDVGEAVVVDALRQSRLLIPLVTRLDEAGTDATGRRFDKSAELAIVTVAGPDGRTVLPAFSSVETMRRWNREARPIPADAVRIALAAANEHTDLVVLDPASATEYVLRRPALWAIGRSEPWIPSYLDPEVLAAFEHSIATVGMITGVRVSSGDPTGRLTGPELAVEISLRPGLDRGSVDRMLTGLRHDWSADDIIAARVDSLSVRLVPE